MHSLKRDNAETESMTIQETGVEQRKKHNGKTQGAPWNNVISLMK